MTEPSEDSDGPLGALIEGIMECVADWYSRNLASETVKGKKERGHQGLHNNRAPFGMKKDDEGVLLPDDDELPGLLTAFEEYATGRYSDTDIARLLNRKGYRSKTGRPFSKDTVRDILQNRTYLGKVKYQKYGRNSNGSRSYAAPVRWFDGQHDAVIDEALFEQCQKVRSKRATHHQATPRYNPYLLRDHPYITIEQYGDSDCIRREEVTAKHTAQARLGLARARDALLSGSYDIVVLDEVNVALWFGLLMVEDVEALLDKRPPNVEVILTGRRAPPELVTRADLVTEMREVKHYYQQKVAARRGIEM